MVSNSFIKSPLNYTGGKHKLLPQLHPFFPTDCNTFVDLFTGGANVVVNTKANTLFAYDINERVIELFNYFKEHRYEEVVTTIEHIIRYYELSDSTTHGYDYYGCDSSKGLGSYNKERFMKLRSDYNEKQTDFPRELLFFSLIIFGFNNQIRFNKKQEFNMPVGKRDFNRNIRKNLEQFMQTLHNQHIAFETKDFRTLDVDALHPGDFVYADPPYLITLAAYNEQDGWTERDEQDLLHLLDQLHSKGVRFALSNVLKKGNVTNELLHTWSRKYTVHELNYNYKNSSYHKKEKDGEELEVLITNYEKTDNI